MKTNRPGAGVLLSTALLAGTLVSTHAIDILWTNTSGGLWSVAENWEPNQVPGPGDAAHITNSGAYVVTLDVDATVEFLLLGKRGAAPSDSVTLAIADRVLTLNASSGSVIRGGDTLDLSGGSVVGTGSMLVIGQVNCSGGNLGVPVLLTNGGTLNWTGGAVSAPLTVASNGVLNVSGSTDKSLYAVLRNAGTIIWSDTGNLILNSFYGSAIHNLAGGLFEAQNDQLCGDCCGGDELFDNAGTFRKSAGSGTTTVSLPFNNTGTVDAQTGTVSFVNGGTVGGSWVMGAGAAVNLAGGDFTQNDTALVSGPGQIAFTSGTLTLTTDVIPNLDLVGGTVRLAPGFQGGSITNLTLPAGALSGNYTVSGTFNWTGGDIYGALTVSNNGVLNVSGSSDKGLHASLTNAGMIGWSGTGNLIRNAYYGGAVFNLASGLFEAQNDQFCGDCCGEGKPFNNAGTFRKSAGSGTTTVALPITNTGTVEARRGTIQFNSGYSNGPSANLAISIGGLTPITDYGLIQFSSPPAFAGAFSILLRNGYRPNPRDTFTVLNFPSAAGGFTSTNGSDLGEGLMLQPVLTSTSLKLVAARGRIIDLMRYESSGWRYLQTNQGGLSGFETGPEPEGFADGVAAFGTTNSSCEAAPQAHTQWDIYTDMLLRRTIILNADFVDLELGVAIDNNIQIWFNGVDISDGMHVDGMCAFQDEVFFQVPPELVQTGPNLLAARARDEGGVTYVDLRLSGSSTNAGAQAPAITSQPQGQTVAEGAPASLSSAAAGTPPLVFQWQHNGANLIDGTNASGSTSNVLTLAATSTNDAGSYRAIVSNPYGSVTSSPAVLTVVAAPLLEDASQYAWTTIAGTVTLWGTADGTNSDARFYHTAGIDVGEDGSLVVVDSSSHTVRRLTPMGTNWVVTTIAGTAGQPGSNDGLFTNQFYVPRGAAWLNSSNILVADGWNSTIRLLTQTGTNWMVTTIAGDACCDGWLDGTSNEARFDDPHRFALDNQGNLYVPDYASSVIRKIAPLGTNWVVSTIAGLAYETGSTDGTNATARFKTPAGIAADNAGILYVADRANHTIRSITPVGTNWVVTTIAGQAGIEGYTDGTNTDALFYAPEDIETDSRGNLYVTDAGNHTVRKLRRVGDDWVVSTIGGLAVSPGSADGTNDAARFYIPIAITADAAGNLYVADTYNYTIRKGVPVINGPPRPEFQAIRQTNDSITFTWSAVPGELYQVQYTTNLSQTNWLDLTGGISATNTTMSASDLIGSDPQRFYRVKIGP